MPKGNSLFFFRFVAQKGWHNMVLDGKKYADEICEALKEKVDDMTKCGITPKLTIITSGNNDASKIYVRNKVRRCEEIGIAVDVKHYDRLTNSDVIDECHSMCPIIFQMPMNGNIFDSSFQNLSADLDADGFVAEENIARLCKGDVPENYPCTPNGIMRLLNHYDIKLAGKSVCIIGRSNIVGRPLARLMEQCNATVTLCHSKTPENVLYDVVRRADIIVSATGSRNVLNINTMKKYYDEAILKDKVFVDVGMNRDENGKLCGDIDPNIFTHCKAYTPVPGGVGPMTVAMLMENVVYFYDR